ncbi:2OG-Fe(II) oxygenase [Pseudoduganella sp. R-32]|uniref:2OG-Fe(II) oxygenase n=1 Tax=Pseudoduganella sp. R-32 TaxID=3404061 RepID=UPI003CF4EB4D
MQFPANLQIHIEKLHAQGTPFTQIVMNLVVTGGYAAHFAQRIVETVLDHGANDFQAVSDERLHGQALPAIDTGKGDLFVELPDRRVRIAMEQFAPRLVLLDDFLSEEECDALCELADDSLEAAMVLHANHEHGIQFDDYRKSDTCRLDAARQPLPMAIERRIEALTGWPQAWGEPLEIQRYGAHGSFKPHYDYFLEGNEYFENSVQNGGQRLATLIVYLKQPERGGATFMANLGVRVMPRKGSALFFSYPTPTVQCGTLHAGDPVQSGEKWIMTKWFRQYAHE